MPLLHWTRAFVVSFHVDLSESTKSQSQCPSLCTSVRPSIHPRSFSDFKEICMQIEVDELHTTVCQDQGQDHGAQKVVCKRQNSFAKGGTP